ncbi:MAG TPA: metal-dependent hydrolase [Dehalococcoidia bacterium]|nr:metal-dependent hydrolase [Dehalococcoidia bacterium]
MRRLFRSRFAAEGAPAAGAGSVFDYRLVAIGSWVPDAIDKPLAWFIIADRVEDDHLLAHTLVLGLVLAMPALYLAWQGKSGLISLTAGVMVHRLCDPMWPEPETVLWPFYGWTFHHSTTPYFPIYLLLEVVAGTALFLVLRRLWLSGRMWLLLGDGQV